MANLASLYISTPVQFHSSTGTDCPELAPPCHDPPLQLTAVDLLHDGHEAVEAAGDERQARIEHHQVGLVLVHQPHALAAVEPLPDGYGPLQSGRQQWFTDKFDCTLPQCLDGHT